MLTIQAIIVTEARFYKTPEGRYYSANGSRGYEFWCRYLDFFKKIYVVARSRLTTESKLSVSSLVEGKGVSVIPLTDYQGPYQYIQRKDIISEEIRNINIKDKTIILRAPGQLSNLIYNRLNNFKVPYSVELVGDPFDVFASRFNIAKLFFRYNFYYKTKKMVKNAVAVSYVTKETLQKRYPTNGYSTNISSVNLPMEFISKKPKEYKKKQLEKDMNIISIGGMDQMYKGFDTLLEAFKLLVHDFPQVKLTIVGDGIYRKNLENLSEKMGVKEHVIFTGQVRSGEGVKSYLNKSDLFVLASRTEGLPRVVIEAMAVGLPRIATQVGGIPELLDKDYLVLPDSPHELYKKIYEFLNNPEEMNFVSKRNIEESYKYENSLLRKRRIQFFKETLKQEEMI